MYQNLIHKQQCLYANFIKIIYFSKLFNIIILLFLPVASDLYFSKYIVTLTIAGKYIRPSPRPVPMPIVKINVSTFCAQTLTIRHTPARKAPAIVTALQPNLLTNDDDIGPESYIGFIFGF